MHDLNLLLLRRRIIRLLAPWERRDDGPGVTIGVVLGRELVVHESAGMASIEHGVPIGPRDHIPHRLGQQAVHMRNPRCSRLPKTVWRSMTMCGATSRPCPIWAIASRSHT